MCTSPYLPSTVRCSRHWWREGHRLCQKVRRGLQISFSEQKPSTDTVAADMENKPFRDNGKLLFRPGGHGALIENLNDLDADVIFIKNIDNVVPDKLKGDTVLYKKLIAGVLITLQEAGFCLSATAGQRQVHARAGS